jgi:hypothetical protein
MPEPTMPPMTTIVAAKSPRLGVRPGEDTFGSRAAGMEWAALGTGAIARRVVAFKNNRARQRAPRIYHRKEGRPSAEEGMASLRGRDGSAGRRIQAV